MKQFVIDDIETMKHNSIQMRKELGIMGAVTTEKIAGIWKGNPVSFKSVWGGHTFTDEEQKALFADQTITFEYVSGKTGKSQVATGKLENQTYNGAAFVGFKLAPRDDVPTTWCGLTFTEQQKSEMRLGLPVTYDKFVSKQGKVFPATITYGAKPDGTKGIIFVNTK